MAGYSLKLVQPENENVISQNTLAELAEKMEINLAELAEYLIAAEVDRFQVPLLFQQFHLESYGDLIAGIFDAITLPTTSAAKQPSLAQLIDDCIDPENLEDNETPPSAKAVTDLKALIAIGDVPIGDVAPYFGEISITWRNGNNMLRATSFSDSRPPRLDYGTTPAGALGTYDFQPNATGAILIERLSWLFPEAATAENTGAD